MADGGGGVPIRPSSSQEAKTSGGGDNSRHSTAALDGAFLLELLRNPPQSQSKHSSPFPPNDAFHPHRDPAVASIGPSYPFAPHSFLRPSPPPPDQFSEPLRFSPPPTSIPAGFGRDRWAPPGFPPQGTNHAQFQGRFQGGFGGRPTYVERDGGNGLGPRGGFQKGRAGQSNGDSRQKSHSMPLHGPFDGNHYGREKGKNMPMYSGNHRPAAVPVGRQREGGGWVPLNERRDGGEENQGEQNGGSFWRRMSSNSHGRDGAVRAKMQINHQIAQPGVVVERYVSDVQHEFVEEWDVGNAERGGRSGLALRKGDCGDADLLAKQVEDSLVVRDDNGEKNVERHSSSSRGKDVRLDLFRGHHVSSQRVRIRRREAECRYDIESLTPYFLSIYKSLIPADEEKGKQQQLLRSLGKLVNKEWPNAQLHLYGSCANSFGVSKSDIDICLAIDDSNMSKPEILLKLADLLQSDNLQNVHALTHARVPIVKMMDPVTGISCDICMNNLLAVVNTKLLRDYAQIDDRLRQLAFIVKHWAKSRGVNETYRGTLSSYAYVLMCIHFLQLRKPSILPCLQEMEATYVVTVDDTHCAFFDQVDRLHNFGSQNTESIARLLWGFFHYWAYSHDYANDVISVRTGRMISKRMKDWTRRIGNDRHLICIEDPFETSHDLGRVVDKYSIKILREEFERAADILQYDSNPSVTLFEPYVPKLPPNGIQSDSNE